ncbi:MAG: glycosyltransferase family 2 protein [Ignavibacteriaceae bacterium]
MSSEGMVSIIMPCYNSEKYIGAALRSVETQTYENWECIVIDDGSSDKSKDIIKGFEARDNRFKYFYQENKGSAGAKNAGIEKAEGEFIQFLDADDVILRDKLKICTGRFKEKPESEIVYTEYCFFSQEKKDGGKEDEGYFYQTLPVKIPSGDVVYSFIFDWNVSFIIPIHSYMFRRKVFEEMKFDNRFKSFAEDIYCWIMIAKKGYRFEYVGDVLAVYRHVETSSTTKETAVMRSKIMMTEYLMWDNRFGNYKKELERVLHFFRQRLVMGLFMEKEFREGLKIFSEELKYSSLKSIGKMGGWLMLMIFFKKETIVKMRLWLIKKTPLKWGGWSHFRLWTPPYEIEI